MSPAEQQQHAEQLATMTQLGHEYGARTLANDVLRWAIDNKAAISNAAIESLLAVLGKHIEL